jgi:uncharacterized membrane protein YeaQ/YmgE (transglycosylase-associated protein family)
VVLGLLLIILGLIGGWFGGHVLGWLGIHAAGQIGYLVTAFIGAVLSVWIARLIKAVPKKLIGYQSGLNSGLISF